jgi:hypothetical protein
MKSAVPPLIANPYPTTCQTGVLAPNGTNAPCSPPSPPTNASLALANGRIVSQDYHLAAGDTWAITSASDGNMYGVPGDIWHEPGPSFDSPMSVWRIQGVPWTGGMWAQFSADLITPLRLFNLSLCDGVDGAQNVKPSAPLGLPGGRLLLGVVCVGVNYTAGSSGNQQTFASGIATSDDFGASWDLAATRNDFFTGALAAPQFVQWGPGMAGAPDGGAFVYAHFFCNAARTAAFWSQNDVALLGRAPAASVLDRAAWSFYAGTGADGAPAWTPDLASAAEVLRFDGFLGQNIAAFNNRTQRYIMASWYVPRARACRERGRALRARVRRRARASVCARANAFPARPDRFAAPPLQELLRGRRRRRHVSECSVVPPGEPPLVAARRLRGARAVGALAPLRARRQLARPRRRLHADDADGLALAERRLALARSQWGVGEL